MLFIALLLGNVIADLCLVRHGQSEGNRDPKKYIERTDSGVRLTEEGKRQARASAEKIKEAFQNSDQKLVFWVSPYIRTRETAKEMLQVLGEKVVTVKEEQLLIERNFGMIVGDGWQRFEKEEQDQKQRNSEEYYFQEMFNFQNIGKTFNPFYTKTPDGESQYDVLLRANQILHKIAAHDPHDRYHHVIITHGVTARTMIMANFHFTQEWYNATRNPCNTAVYHMNKDELKILYTGFHEKTGLQCDIQKVQAAFDKAHEEHVRTLNSYYGDHWSFVPEIEDFKAIDDSSSTEGSSAENSSSKRLLSKQTSSTTAGSADDA
jgi:broad specificity phosphatase PhoE